MEGSLIKKKGQIIRTIVLLILGILYIALVAATFLFKIDLATNVAMQYVLHITVILSAISYLFFIDMIYSTENNNENGRLALIFAALFTIPVLIGRGIGITYISNISSNAVDGIFNFYGTVSVSRTIELISWTTFYPFSMLFLAKIFFEKKERFTALAWLCLLSSICCFIAFMCIISAEVIYLYIGLMGWGILFLLIIIAYLFKQIQSER